MIRARVDDSQQIRHSDKSVYLSFNYSPTIVARVKELPNRWYSIKTREWEIPYTDLPLLMSRFDGEIVGLEAVGAYTSSTNEQSVINRLDGITTDIDFKFKTVPFPHQIECFNFGIKRNCLLIADEQGLGKTKESIDIAVARRQLNGITGVLIVCGVNSVRFNWESEIKIHSDETVQLVDGSSKERVHKLRNSGEYFFNIINVESLRNPAILSEIIDLIDHNKISMVIFDEVHKAKNGQCQQGRALVKLNTPFKLALTGTPITSRAEDLWNILHWLGVERNSFWQYRGRYCVMGGYGGHNVVAYRNLDELSLKLKRAMIRRKKDEVFDLPPKLHSYEYVELTPKQRVHYNSIRQGILKRIDEIVALPNPLTEFIRLRQCTSGLEVLEVDGKDNPKLDRLKELLEEVIIPNGKKLVVFSQWGKVTKILRRELKKYNPAYITGEVKDSKRQEEVKRFQNDSTCRVCIGTISAMGTGLTLTAGEYVVFMDRAWTSADNEQAEDRCHRIGTTGTVNVITMIAQGTVDERVENIIKQKKDLSDAVVEGRAVKVNMRELIMDLLA